MLQKITRRSLESFLPQYASSALTLDVGAGGSAYGRWFPHRVMVDVDPARGPDIVADAHALPFADNSFDLLLCTEMLEHVVDPPRALSEMRGVLKPDGRLLLTTRFVYPLHDTPNDYFRFTRFGLEYLLREWSDVVIAPELSTMETLGALLQRITFQTDMRGGKLTKAIFTLVAWCCTKGDRLIRREYGDIHRSARVSGMMASGYLITARKKVTMQKHREGSRSIQQERGKVHETES
jgi:SAM-dependent methyltransferase